MGAQTASSWAEIGMWALIGIGAALILGFGVLWVVRNWSELTIPSVAHPWQNALLQLVGVLVALIGFILYYF